MGLGRRVSEVDVDGASHCNCIRSKRLGGWRCEALEELVEEFAIDEGAEDSVGDLGEAEEGDAVGGLDVRDEGDNGDGDGAGAGGVGLTDEPAEGDADEDSEGVAERLIVPPGEGAPSDEGADGGTEDAIPAGFFGELEAGLEHDGDGDGCPVGFAEMKIDVRGVPGEDGDEGGSDAVDERVPRIERIVNVDAESELVHTRPQLEVLLHLFRPGGPVVRVVGLPNPKLVGDAALAHDAR